MKHRVKVTVLDTLLYEDLQQKYCQNPCSGKCEFSHARERCSHRCERLKNLVVH